MVTGEVPADVLLVLQRADASAPADGRAVLRGPCAPRLTASSDGTRALEASMEHEYVLMGQ